MAFGQLKYKIKLWQCNKKWKKEHPDSKVYFERLINLDKVSIGKGTYGSLNIMDYSPQTGKAKVKIGAYCSIAMDNLFLLGGGHPLHYATTYPFKNMLCGQEESLENGDIIIKDDVWIGAQATIMSGVTIGQGAVIGAKALVTHDIPPYAIAVGIPAKVIKYRFNEETINELMKIDFSKFGYEIIKKNIELFETTADINVIKNIQKMQYNQVKGK